MGQKEQRMNLQFCQMDQVELQRKPPVLWPWNGERAGVTEILRGKECLGLL